MPSGFVAVTKAGAIEKTGSYGVLRYPGETHKGRQAPRKAWQMQIRGDLKSRQLPAPLGMVLFPRLLTCSDNCILRVPDVRALWLLLLVLAGLASWPGPVLLTQCMCACTTVRTFGHAAATRQVISKFRDAGRYFFAGSCLLVPPGHCLQSATWSRPGHSLLLCVIVHPLHSCLLRGADTQRTTEDTQTIPRYVMVRATASRKE